MSNGLRTQDTPGTQGWQEASPQSLQQQTREDAGGAPVKKDRYIYIENASSTIKPFLVHDVGTVDEVVEKICDWIPSLCSSAIQMRISNTRMGTMHRNYFQDSLPQDAFFLYVTLSLKKHPSLSIP